MNYAIYLRVKGFKPDNPDGYAVITAELDVPASQESIKAKVFGPGTYYTGLDKQYDVVAWESHADNRAAANNPAYPWGTGANFSMNRSQFILKRNKSHDHPVAFLMRMDDVYWVEDEPADMVDAEHRPRTFVTSRVDAETYAVSCFPHLTVDEAIAKVRHAPVYTQG